MEVTETGTVLKGGLSLDRPLPLDDGAKVVVRVAEVAALPQVASDLTDREFRSQEFFGQWADRPELTTSEEYVRQEREKWSPRLAREE